MKGLIIKSLVVVALALGASNYLIYLKTGRLPVDEWRKNWSTQALVDWYEALSFADWGAETRHMRDRLRGSDDSAGSAAVTVYKWTDAQGQVHYGQQPRAGAQALEIHPDESAMSAATAVPAAAKAQAAAGQDEASVLDKARAAADSMSKHYQEQDKNY
jgi:hypothetical protein